MSYRLMAMLILAALVAVSASPAAAQTTDESLRALHHQLESLRQGQERLQRDMQELKDLLRTRGQAAGPELPKDLAFALAGRIVKGAPAAKVVVAEFTDYQCPFCARYVRETLPRIEQEYVKTGRIRYTVREFPLEQIHPQAFTAAEAALCAGDQGKYWEMHARLFEHQKALGADQLPGHAAAVGVEPKAFAECLQSGRHGNRVRADLGEGAKAGVRGTPMFFIGIADESGAMKAVRALRGAVPFASFQAAIDAVLAEVK
jgi:protein-disulfide isomerase